MGHCPEIGHCPKTGHVQKMDAHAQEWDSPPFAAPTSAASPKSAYLDSYLKSWGKPGLI